MAIGAYGRIDWMPRFGVWKVIGYTKNSGKGIREVEIGRAIEKETALAILHDWYQDNKWVVRYA